MLKTLTNECRAVWRTPPGDRFHARFRRTRRRKGNGEMGPRIVRLGVAMVCVGLGLAFLLLPIPSTPFFITSGALFASESAPVARFLDRLELLLRSWANAARRKWRSLSPAGKRLVAALGVLVVLGKAYCVYRVYRYYRG